MWRRARQVIEFWAYTKIPMSALASGMPVMTRTPRQSTPEAAHDSMSRSGMRTDITSTCNTGISPRQGRVWLANPKLIYETRGFSGGPYPGANGLLHEGGIVEWTGYLPATNI